MRRWTILFGIGSLAGLAPAMAETPPYYDDQGTMHYQGSGTFQCGRAPVALDGSHTDVTLQGPCWRVVVHGSHSDTVIYTVPGARLEATGDSNDITWKQIRRGRPPILQAWGSRDEFYRNSRSSPQQNHDRYQEVR